MSVILTDKIQPRTTGIALTVVGDTNVSGALTCTNFTASGDVSIGGTLTYEDVTNIDSVGLITARTGVRVTAGGVVVTAGVSTFTDDVKVNSTLTATEGINVSAGIVTVNDYIQHAGDTNTAIRFPAADQIQFETAGSNRLNIGSTGNLQFNTTTNGQAVILKSTGNHYNKLQFDSGNTSAGGELAYVDFSWDGDKVADILAIAGSDTTNKDDGHLVFRTSPSQGNIAERLRIDSSGRALIGTSSAINSSTVKLQVASTDATGSAVLARFSASSYSSYLDFYKSRNATLGSETVVNSGDHLGAFRFYGCDGNGYTTAAEIYGTCDGGAADGDMPGRLTFHTTADGASTTTERLRIDSGGRLLVGTAANQHGGGDLLQVAATSSTASLSLNRYTANAHPSYINFFKSRDASLSGQTVVQDDDTLGLIAFYGSDGTDRALGAEVCAQVDGTPGSDDMPGRLVFRTSADGSQTPSERLRIQSDGTVRFYNSIYGGDNKPIYLGTSNDLSLFHDSGGASIIRYNHSVGGLHFRNNSNADKMVLDSSGRVCINQSSSPTIWGYVQPYLAAIGNYEQSSASFINNEASTNNSAIVLAKRRGASTIVNSGDILGAISWQGWDGVDFEPGARIKCEVDTTPGEGDMPGRLIFETTADGAEALTERMRIDNSGAVRINATSAVSSELFTIQKSNAQIAYFDSSGTSDVTTIQCRNRRGSGSTYGMQMEFRPSADTAVGYISTNGSNCLFGNNSDYRLKENVVNLTNGITRIKNLKPYRFNFKTTPDETVDGFYAHEASTVVSNAVVGDKDAVNDDGSIKPQAMDNAKLVPLLTAALQEAITKIETLETKVAALESS